MSKQPTISDELRDLIEKVDRVWNGVVWRLAVIGALLLIAAVVGGALR